MQITNRRSDVENKKQVNYGLYFSRDFLTDGVVKFFSYKYEENDNRYWGNIFRKGFNYILRRYGERDMLSARVVDKQTGETKLMKLTDVVDETARYDTEKYDVVGFQCSKNVSLEDREKMEVDLIRSFVSASQNGDLNLNGNEFSIQTHESGVLTYVPDGTSKGVDIEQVGKELGIKTSEGFLLGFNDQVKQYDKRLYGKDKEVKDKSSYSKEDIVNDLFTKLDIEHLRGNKGLEALLLNEIEKLQERMYDKQEFSRQEYDVLIDCFSKNEQGVILANLNVEKANLGMTHERNSRIEITEEGNAIGTTYIRGELGNVQGGLKKQIEEYTSDGEQKTKIKYSASFVGMTTPKILDIDDMIKSNRVSEESYEKKGNVVYAEKKQVAAYTYPHHRYTEVAGKEKYAYTNKGSQIQEKDITEIKDILPDLQKKDRETNAKIQEESQFSGMSFFDVVDDYLTGINLMSEEEKNRSYNYIQDVIKTGDIASNIKIYDEMIKRSEENKLDDFIHSTAGQFALNIEQDIKSKMNKLSEAESDKMLNDLQMSVQSGNDAIRDLAWKEKTPENINMTNSIKHKTDTYTKFAKELESIREM